MRCFQLRYCRISLMVARETPYVAAASAAVSLLSRMARTSCSERMAHPCVMPLAFLFFFTISSILLICLATNRCFVLQHGRLSQLCMTTWSSGTSIPENLTAMTWALCILPSNQNCPYPFGIKQAVHNQQSSGPRISTLFENLSGQMYRILILLWEWATDSLAPVWGEW